MKCQSLINQFLLDYHAGTLSPARRIDFELHLLLCAPCRRYVDSYKKTIALAQASADNDPEMPVPPELIQAILTLSQSLE